MYLYPENAKKPDNDWDGYGGAVSVTYEKEDGTLWVSSDDEERPEYVSQVNFCPFTGYEAKVKIGAKPE